MTRSIALELIYQEFNQVTEPSLWILDENFNDQLPPADPNISVISNRIDVVQDLSAKGWQIKFSDYDLLALNEKYQFIFYRISKEKAVTHHVINSAGQLLQPTGKLIIAGAKQEGVKGYLDRSSSLFQNSDVWKADKQHWAGAFSTPLAAVKKLDDKNYTQLQLIENAQLADFYSKPGVFGWNKIDQGSAMLIEELQSLFHLKDFPEEVLDLGCGYGYLSILSAKLFNCAIVATDNNAAAIKACEKNLSFHQIQADVIASNCAAGINKTFPLIICNPPFHSGFDVENNLTDRFLAAAKKNLKAKGVAVFVVNLHIPLERKAANFFNKVSLLAKNDHFKVIKMEQ